MYCRNCGNKLTEKDFYCPECGSKIKSNKTPLIDFQKLEKKYKKQLLGLLLILIVLLSYNFINNHFFSEEAIIKKYVTAYANKDYETVVKLSNITTNKFITKETINNKYGSKENDQVEVTTLTTNKTKKEHTRTVSYTINNSNNIISLKIKKSGHKFLIFNNYVVTSTDIVANNIKIIVPKDCTLIVDEVKLGKKDQLTTKDNLTTYQINNILKKNVKIVLQLKNNITVTDTKSLFNNEEIDYSKLNYEELDKKSKEQVVANIKGGLNNIIKNALASNDLKNISDSNLYTEELKNSSLFEESYNELKEKYQNKEIKNFEITNINIDNIKLEKTENIMFRVTMKYKYQDKNSKEHETSRSVNISLNYDYLINEFYLSNLSYLF